MLSNYGKYETAKPRFLALFIDSLVFLPLTILSYAVGDSNLPLVIFYLWVLVVNLAYPFYTILMHARYGQTLGKMVAKVKVVDLNDNPITIQHAVMRELPQIIFNSSLIFVSLPNTVQAQDASYFSISSVTSIIGFSVIFWSISDILVFLFNDKRRALHDFIAKTVVIRLNP